MIDTSDASSGGRFSSALDIRYGRDPYLDAWILHFMTENSIEYTIDPAKNASPEQLRFMVSLEPDQVYVPCTDEMLTYLLDKRLEPPLLRQYNERWDRIVRLIEDCKADDYTKKRVMALCEHKYRQALTHPTLIPSRLMKRLNTIFLTQSGQDDPSRERKRLLNRRAFAFVQRPEFKDLLYACPGEVMACRTIPDMRFELNSLELKRLFSLSCWPRIWDQDGPPPSREELAREMAGGTEAFEALRTLVDPHRHGEMKILYLPDVSGGFVIDLLFIRTLLRMGHRVIVALKEGFYFDAPTFWDAEEDPLLTSVLAGAYFLEDNRAGKNELLRIIRENPLVVISDGTRERLNLHRVSVTFARTWKEADLVIAKGEFNHRRLLLTSHQFTRDILSFRRDREGGFHLELKKKAPGIRKFTEADIKAKAEEIIQGMRSARLSGKSVMFYSAIIGSIPGQTKKAIAVVNAFIAHLRERLTGTIIINPAEHFEEGMDADDLMFMWERVQRCGLIDVWRFQSHSDIEKSFELMGQPVPPAWAGKDATFSTGCTKEMHIALSMQSKQPELQIIGPEPEKFFRRREYGVGKFCDAAIPCE
ncbi:ARMT1-like domain-containing protein [Desulfolutivibrio sp.]|uniref:ARMT1-like domain-containing protein n=1 Tax=Desulfolutivibrio sp. TaxID=2773296 RepID=UPI002F968A19